MDKSDAQLIEESIAGDETAFDSLVRRHLDALYNYLFRISGSAEDAADLSQETFVKAWKHLARFDPERNFKTWLFAIGRNATIDLARKKKSVAFSRLDLPEESFEETVPDTEPLADEAFSKKQSADELEAALALLAPSYREAIVLHDMEGLTFEEVASVTGSPMNTVKSRYRRACAMLKTRLSPR